MLLAGDIGGTKTLLGVYSPEQGPRAPLAEHEYKSADYASLADMAREFLAQVDLPVTRASFDVAGPVVAGRARVTNLPWVVETENLKRELNLSSVALMNDLEAIAEGVLVLEPDDYEVLNEGRAHNGGAIAVIAPGTGLGEAYLAWDGERYHTYPSEGGHADFAPSNPIELGMLENFWKSLPHVSVERVCSGRGIPHIYDYLRDRGYAPETPAVAKKLATAPDRTPVISEAALDADAPCALCRATIETFVSALGAEAGNMALKVLSTGGVYLGGGVPKRILPILRDGRFMHAFLRKGRMNDLLSKMPVRVITRQAAILGAASYGLAME